MILENKKFHCQRDYIEIDNIKYDISKFKRGSIFNRQFSDLSLQNQLKAAKFILQFYVIICKEEGRDQHSVGHCIHRKMRHRNSKSKYKLYKVLCKEMGEIVESIKFEIRMRGQYV